MRSVVLPPHWKIGQILVSRVGTVNVEYVEDNKVHAFLRRGWFPFSYTRVLPESDSEKLKVKYEAFFHKLSL